MKNKQSFQKLSKWVLLREASVLIFLLVFTELPGFGQTITYFHDNKASVVIDNDLYRNAKYKAWFRDVLGVGFQTEEDLHVRVGTHELKYHIGPSRKSITLEFGINQPGYFPYKIYGRFRHLDGSWYEVTGSGRIYVKGGELFNLYLLSLDPKTKKAIALIR